MKKTFSILFAFALILSLFAATANADTATTASKPVVQNFQGKVDIGGYSLYIQIHGVKKDDAPTLVFENGNGDTDQVWYDKSVAQTLAQNNLVVTYDRIGMGSSDKPANADYTAQAEATRLHTLLHNAGVKAPYVLVAHSIGGLYVREFQYLWPSEVKGIVFVDSALEHEENILFPDPTFTDADRAAIMEDDLSNGTGTPVEGSYDDMLASYAQLDTEKSADALRHVPITVLSAQNHGYPSQFPNMEQYWADCQNIIAGLSNDVVHSYAPTSTHYIMEDDPNAVITAVNGLLQRVASCN